MSPSDLVPPQPTALQPIHRPDLDPFKLGLLNLFGCGGLGYWLIGQKRKAVQTWMIVLIGSPCTCGTLYVFAFVAAYDAYLLGQRMELGESITPDQNALAFLGSIFR